MLTLSSSFLWATSYQSLETDYFSIIHKVENLEEALEIAQFSEEIYFQLATLFNYYPKEKIRVVLEGDILESNGYFSFFPPKITLFLNQPASRFLGSKHESYLKSLFKHELTHYFHLNQNVGFARYLRPIFGPATYSLNSFLMPKWWIEGIATYSENARGNSNLFALKYEAPIYEEKFFSLAKATYNSPVFPYDRSYIAGYFIVSKLAQEFGEDKIGEINANYTSFPLKSLNSSFKKSIGLKATDLYLKAINQVKEQFKDFDSYSSLNKPYKGQYFYFWDEFF